MSLGNFYTAYDSAGVTSWSWISTLGPSTVLLLLDVVAA
jgi:hypothetical protein